MECSNCNKERERRNRLIGTADPRVQQAPFVTAPYIHKNNQPKYHAMLLRAAEDAKKRKKYILWFSSKDEAENPAQVTMRMMMRTMTTTTMTNTHGVVDANGDYVVNVMLRRQHERFRISDECCCCCC